ncbi:MAG: dockerin type I repeat-containing protein, partial [Chloroflexota bacterium]
GETVLYLSNQAIRDIYELYTVSINGGISIKLVEVLSTDSPISDYQISPDNLSAVYRQSTLAPFSNNIYAVAINGGTRIRLNEPGNIVDLVWEISSDSNTVVYMAYPDDSFSILNLYSVPISGGEPTRLNTPANTQSNGAGSFEITPDGKTVIYLEYLEPLTGTLHLVPVNGGTAQQITSFPNIFSFEISPDSQWLVFGFDRTLYTYPLSEPEVLNYDVNNDGRVTPADAIYIINRLDDTIDETNAFVDVDNNGIINITDANLVIKQIGQTLD